MDLDQLIKEVSALRDGMPQAIEGFIEKRSKYLVGAVKRDRLWGQGRDGDGNLIGGGKYSPRTIERKKKSPYSRTSHITLRDTNKWHNSLFATYYKGELSLDSTMPGLTEKLINGEHKGFKGYGKAIMEFTQEELDVFEEDILSDLKIYLQTLL